MQMREKFRLSWSIAYLQTYVPFHSHNLAGMYSRVTYMKAKLCTTVLLQMNIGAYF